MRACGYVQCGVDSLQRKNDLVGGDLPLLLLLLLHGVVSYVVTLRQRRHEACTAFDTAQGTIRAKHEGETQTEQQVTLPWKDIRCVPEIIAGETRTIGRAL